MCSMAFLLVLVGVVGIVILALHPWDSKLFGTAPAPVYLRG